MSPIEPRAPTSPATAAVSIGERAAVFAFSAWLSGRKETSGPFGASYDAGELAALAGRFCESQGWPDVPDGWDKQLRPYPGE
jgi:hypothetical protein